MTVSCVLAFTIPVTLRYYRNRRWFMLGATIKLSTQRLESPKSTTQHHDISFQSTLDRRPMYYSYKMNPNPSSPNTNSIMWTHTSLETNIKFKLNRSYFKWRWVLQIMSLPDQYRIVIFHTNIKWISHGKLLYGYQKHSKGKTNWKYWIEYIKPIWCPQHLWHRVGQSMNWASSKRKS